MSTTIWKFPLGKVRDGPVVVDMPVGAWVLSLQLQGGVPTLWAWVKPAASTEERRFCWFGTGQPLPIASLRHVGTVQMEGDQAGLVFHLFEEV